MSIVFAVLLVPAYGTFNRKTKQLYKIFGQLPREALQQQEMLFNFLYRGSLSLSLFSLSFSFSPPLSLLFSVLCPLCLSQSSNVGCSPVHHHAHRSASVRGRAEQDFDGGRRKGLPHAGQVRLVVFLWPCELDVSSLPPFLCCVSLFFRCAHQCVWPEQATGWS